MAISEQTQAIIDKLEKEGKLLRNDGRTNSIKMVRADISKLTNVFEAMRENLSMMSENEAERIALAQREAELRGLSDEARRRILEDEANRKERENTLANRDLALRERDMKRREKEGKEFKILGKDGLLASLFGGTFNMIKKALFVGIAGSILYEIMGGFLERFGINIPTLSETFTKLSELVADPSWEGIKSNLLALSKPDLFGPLLSAVGLGLGASAVTAYVAKVGIMEIVKKLLLPDMDDINKGSVLSRGAFAAARVAIVGVVFAGITAIMPTIEDLFRQYVLEMTPQEIATRKVDAVDIGGNAVTSLAGLFMPGGPWVKLFATVAIFTFKTVADYIEQWQDKDNVSNAVKDLRSELNTLDDRIEEALANRALAIKYGGDGLALTAEIDRLNKEREAALKNFTAEARAAVQKREDAQADLESIKREDFVTEKMSNTKIALLAGGDPMLTAEYSTYGDPLEDEKRFVAAVKKREEALAVAERQLSGLIGLAADYKLTAEDLDLVKSGDSYTTKLKLFEKAKRDQEAARKAEAEASIVEAYNKKQSDANEFFIPVTTVKEVLDRINQEAMINGPSRVQQILNMPVNYSPVQAIDAKTQSASSVTTFRAGGIDIVDNGYQCVFPGAVR